MKVVSYANGETFSFCTCWEHVATCEWLIGEKNGKKGEKKPTVWSMEI